MVDVFMALLSFVDSTPRAYRLKASNAAPPISTSPGTFPSGPSVLLQKIAEGFVRKLLKILHPILGQQIERVPSLIVELHPFARHSALLHRRSDVDHLR
jgi:hypothetical protein